MLGSIVSFDKVFQNAVNTNGTLSKLVFRTSAEVTKSKALQREKLWLPPYLQNLPKIEQCFLLANNKHTLSASIYNLLQAQTITSTHTAALWEESPKKAFVATVMHFVSQHIETRCAF